LSIHVIKFISFVGKLIGLGSDGASNMTGKKGGLATLLKLDVNRELLNVHCFAHRLELAFRDCLKSTNYEKLMTLLIGLYYFYTKSHNNKTRLLESIAAHKQCVLPKKVTGTRWLPHLSRGIDALFKTFRAFEGQLSSNSHDNAKAEGLCKILISKDLICFAVSPGTCMVFLMQSFIFMDIFLYCHSLLYRQSLLKIKMIHYRYTTAVEHYV
jgi:hypothetical protein